MAFPEPNKASNVGCIIQLNLRVVGATAPTTAPFCQCGRLSVVNEAVHFKFGFDYSQNLRNTRFFLRLFLSFLTTGERDIASLSDVPVSSEAGSEQFLKQGTAVAPSPRAIAMLWFESNSRIVMHDDSETSGFFSLAEQGGYASLVPHPLISTSGE